MQCKWDLEGFVSLRIWVIDDFTPISQKRVGIKVSIPHKYSGDKVNVAVYIKEITSYSYPLWIASAAIGFKVILEWMDVGPMKVKVSSY